MTMEDGILRNPQNLDSQNLIDDLDINMFILVPIW